MKKMPNDYVKLTVTSPPYDDLRTYNKNVGANKEEFNGYSFPFEEIAKELAEKQ
jgi:site-specific DNA-methyltransferase (adenine-specific)